jgi:hypothetical protein
MNRPILPDPSSEGIAAVRLETSAEGGFPPIPDIAPAAFSPGKDPFTFFHTFCYTSLEKYFLHKKGIIQQPFGHRVTDPWKIFSREKRISQRFSTFC